ncbi:hypothetical protein ACIHDR_14675 [Nocardia sp. NPDC052278]|uniref:hypothetical protein n=1 Tax=unclassified Nocardia TaxID=2637762 RepID=UPI003674D2F5
MRPKVVWALDFQFDSTVDGRAVKIASKIDEHTRESLLHLVKRSITAERLVAKLEKAFHRAQRAAAGATVLRRQCRDSLPSAGTPWNNGFVESFNRRLRPNA